MVGKRMPQQISFDTPTPATRARDLLRAINELVDFEFVREMGQPYFADGGRPSVDPVLMLKMMLVGYLFDINSDRRLVDERAEFEYVGSFCSDPGSGLIMDGSAHAREHAGTALEHIWRELGLVDEFAGDTLYDHAATLAALQQLEPLSQAALRGLLHGQDQRLQRLPAQVRVHHGPAAQRVAVEAAIRA